MAQNSMLNISAYAGGVVYPPNLEKNMQDIQAGGWTSLIIGLFHVDANGNIFMNDAVNQTITNGMYNGPAAWPAQLAQLKTGGSIKTLLASFGGWDDVFQNILTIYCNNNHSFNGTQLETNTWAFRKAFPAIDMIDMDVEFPDGPSEDPTNCIIDFTKMWIAAGFDISFCPYEAPDFWANCLAGVEKTNPGRVKWWNLQCYAGGGSNHIDSMYNQWIDQINTVLPNFNTNNYIMVSDWTRFWNTQAMDWEGHCPPDLQSWLSAFKGKASVGGGFIWNIDQVYSYAADAKKNPDPNPCTQMSMKAYVSAIKQAIG